MGGATVASVVYTEVGERVAVRERSVAHLARVEARPDVLASEVFHVVHCALSSPRARD